VEEAEGLESGSAGADAAGASGVDPIAVALALNGASREKADAFLDEQRALAANQSALIADQRHHLHEQFKHLTEQFKQLRLGTWEKRLGVLLRIATAFTGLAIAAGLAFLIWDASQSNGLLIEPFSVPSDLAARGLTGQVVAAQVLDRVAVMQAQTVSQRAQASYANSWNHEDIKLDIPETGVSLTELDNFLRVKLGHDTHVTGEIVRTPTGLSLTARAGADATPSVTGTEAEMDALVQRLAESIYKLTQPYRYAVYLNGHGRAGEAMEILKALALGRTVAERPWGYNGWAVASQDSQGPMVALGLMRKAILVGPDNYLPQNNIADVEAELSLPEQTIADARKALQILSGPGHGRISAEALAIAPDVTQAFIDMASGAYHDAAQKSSDAIASGVKTTGASARLALAETGEHDLEAARAAMVEPFGSELVPGLNALAGIVANMTIAREAQDWTGMASVADTIAPLAQKYPGLRLFALTMTAPLLAYADAQLDRKTEAEAVIGATPADCYNCLITRARIAELEGQHVRADYWFARAIDGQKSIPFGYSYWGQALLDRGQPDAAIKKFTVANQKGPHFADPLEGWGEALMAKNQSHLALAKFAEAEKYAPNWGRLHLKWGEALVYASKKDEARAQFSRAAQLDLVAADRAELARMNHG